MSSTPRSRAGPSRRRMVGQLAFATAAAVLAGDRAAALTGSWERVFDVRGLANISSIHRQFELVSAGQLEEAAALFSDPTRNHGREVPRQFVLAIFQDIKTTFPDWSFTIEEIVAAGDDVVVRCRLRGTHRGVGRLPVNGGLMIGVPPTGRADGCPAPALVCAQGRARRRTSRRQGRCRHDAATWAAAANAIRFQQDGRHRRRADGHFASGLAATGRTAGDHRAAQDRRELCPVTRMRETVMSLWNLVSLRFALAALAGMAAALASSSASATNEEYQFNLESCGPLSGCTSLIFFEPSPIGYFAGGAYGFASGYNGGFALASASFVPGAPQLLASGVYRQAAVSFFTYTFQVRGAPDTLVPLHMIGHVSVSPIHLTDPSGSVATLVDNVPGPPPSDKFKIVASSQLQVGLVRGTP